MNMLSQSASFDDTTKFRPAVLLSEMHIRPKMTERVLWEEET